MMEGNGKESSIQGRIKQLRAQIEETTSDFDREKLQKRLALSCTPRARQSRKASFRAAAL